MSSTVQKYVNRFKKNYESDKFENDTKFVDPAKKSGKSKNCRNFLCRIAVYALYDIEKLTPENLSFKDGFKAGQISSYKTDSYVSYSINEECKNSKTEKKIITDLYHVLNIKLEKNPSSEAKIAKLKKILTVLKEARKYSAKWIRNGVISSYLFDLGKTEYWKDCIKAVSQAIENVSFEKEENLTISCSNKKDESISPTKIDNDKFCKKFLSNLSLYAKNNITKLTPENLGLKDANKLDGKNIIASNSPEDFATALLSKECKRSKTERKIVLDLYNALNIELKENPSPEAKIAKLEKVIRALKKAKIYSAKWIRKGIFDSYFFGGIGKTKLWNKCIKDLKEVQKSISFEHETPTSQKILDEFYNEIDKAKERCIKLISKNNEDPYEKQAIEELKNLSARDLLGDQAINKINTEINSVKFNPDSSYPEQLLHLVTKEKTIGDFVSKLISNFIKDYMAKNTGPNQPVILPEETPPKKPKNNEKQNNINPDSGNQNTNNKQNNKKVKTNGKGLKEVLSERKKKSENNEENKDSENTIKLISDLFIAKIKEIGEDILKGKNTKDKNLTVDLFKTNNITSIDCNEFLKSVGINTTNEIKKVESKFNKNASDDEKNKFLDDLMKSATKTNSTIQESLEKYLYEKIKKSRKDLIYSEFLSRINGIGLNMVTKKTNISDKNISDWLNNNKISINAEEILKNDESLKKNISEEIDKKEPTFDKNAPSDKKNKFFDELMESATKTKKLNIQGFLEEHLSKKIKSEDTQKALGEALKNIRSNVAPSTDESEEDNLFDDDEPVVENNNKNNPPENLNDKTKPNPSENSNDKAKPNPTENSNDKAKPNPTENSNDKAKPNPTENNKEASQQDLTEMLKDAMAARKAREAEEETEEESSEEWSD